MTRAAVLAPLPPGEPLLLGARPGPDLAAAGWLEREYTASGTATAYRAVSQPADGRWSLAPDRNAPFRTRVLVRRPEPARPGATLVVEWLNVSGGGDVGPDWTYLADELMRRGVAWAGVSAQQVGVAALAAQRAERYGELDHPGDAFAFDMYEQVARAVRASLGAGTVLAVGESQSAAALTSYINGVHPLASSVGGVDPPASSVGGADPPASSVGGVDPPASSVGGADPPASSVGGLDTLPDPGLRETGAGPRPAAAPHSAGVATGGGGVFDGFLVHSRSRAALPFDIEGAADISGLLAGPVALLRDDLDVPVMVVQTEGDVFEPLHWLDARQPDTPMRRTWEIAGNAHADRYLLGEFESALGLPHAANSGQQVFVLRAALRHLERWARGGPPPPAAPSPLAAAAGEFVRDEHGNVVGGVRTPVVEAPVERLSGLPMPDAEELFRLFGSTTPLTGVWPDRETYLAAYAAAVDDAIAAGFALRDDRDELLADSREHLIV